MKAFCWDCKKFNERTYDALTNIVDIKETDIQVQITPNNWTKSENCFASEYKDKFQASCNPILIDRRELFDQIFKCEVKFLVPSKFPFIKLTTPLKF